MPDIDDNPIEWAIQTATGAATDALVPLPKNVRRSLFRALSTLIAGAVDVPAAWLESKAQAIRDKAAAQTLFTERMAQATTQELASDSGLVRRATMHFASRLLGEQRNREEVAKVAVAELQSSPPDRDADAEIDDDWLNVFSRVAEQRSNAEMQAYLGKILAGEIRRPGSFSPATIQALATLTPALAELFQRLCNLSISNPEQGLPPMVIWSPFARPEDNGLMSLGLPYESLTVLQDAGLLKKELQMSWTLPAEAFSTGAELAGRRIAATASDKFDPRVERDCRIMMLTTAGVEIRQIVQMTPDPEYLAKLKEWMLDNYSLEIVLAA